MKKRRCNICFKAADFQFLVAKDYFLGSKKEYKYAKCLKCNSLFLVEIPDNLSKLYENYYSFDPPNPLSKFRFNIYRYILRGHSFGRKFLQFFLKEQDDLPIKSLVPVRDKLNGRVLDVGCGSGSLLSILHKIGVRDSIGIDPYLKKDIEYPTGLRIIKKDFMALEGKFDLIMFHHVFEHFSKLKEVLKHVCKLLSKNGVCIIRIPDVDSYSFFRYKENWFSIHAPFHVSLPSRKGMKEIVKDTGLAIENIIGEQLVEFFLYSKGHELGIADYEKYGNRRFIKKYGIKKPPPLHIKDELKKGRQRLKQVKKYDLCDWTVYYLKKKDIE